MQKTTSQKRIYEKIVSEIGRVSAIFRSIHSGDFEELPSPFTDARRGNFDLWKKIVSAGGERLNISMPTRLEASLAAFDRVRIDNLTTFICPVLPVVRGNNEAFYLSEQTLKDKDSKQEVLQNRFRNIQESNFAYSYWRGLASCARYSEALAAILYGIPVKYCARVGALSSSQVEALSYGIPWQFRLLGTQGSMREKSPLENIVESLEGGFLSMRAKHNLMCSTLRESAGDLHHKPMETERCVFEAGALTKNLMNYAGALACLVTKSVSEVSEYLDGLGDAGRVARNAVARVRAYSEKHWEQVRANSFGFESIPMKAIPAGFRKSIAQLYSSAKCRARNTGCEPCIAEHWIRALVSLEFEVNFREVVGSGRTNPLYAERG